MKGKDGKTTTSTSKNRNRLRTTLICQYLHCGKQLKYYLSLGDLRYAKFSIIPQFSKSRKKHEKDKWPTVQGCPTESSIFFSSSATVSSTFMDYYSSIRVMSKLRLKKTVSIGLVAPILQLYILVYVSRQAHASPKSR